MHWREDIRICRRQPGSPYRIKHVQLLRHARHPRIMGIPGLPFNASVRGRDDQLPARLQCRRVPYRSRGRQGPDSPPTDVLRKADFAKTLVDVEVNHGSLSLDGNTIWGCLLCLLALARGNYSKVGLLLSSGNLVKVPSR